MFILCDFHLSTRVFHHAFHLTVAPVHVWKFRHPMDWKLLLLERIYGYYGDRNGIETEKYHFPFFVQIFVCPSDGFVHQNFLIAQKIFIFKSVE
jgi:hypothetical protein